MWRERAYPYGVAIGVTLFYYLVGGPLPPNADAYNSIMGASAGVAAIFVGFLSASKAIILSISSSKAFVRLVKSGYKKELFLYIKHAMYISLTFSIFCIGFMFVNVDDVNSVTGRYADYFMCVWVFLISSSVATFYRVASLMFKILDME